PDGTVEHLFRHALELDADDHARVGRDAELGGDRDGRTRVITRHHDGANAGTLRARDRLLRLRARRVHHPDQPEEDELVLDAIVRRLLEVDGVHRQGAEGYGEGPKALAGERVVPGGDLGAAFGRKGPCFRADELVRAAGEEDV